MAWQYYKNGKLRAVKGGAKGVTGSAVNAQMPNLDHITNVNEMQVLLGQYVELINDPLERHTAKVLHQQDLRRFGEGSPEVRSIDSILQNFQNERDRIAAEYQLLHGDDARYYDASGKKKFDAKAFLEDRKSWHKPFAQMSLLSGSVATTLAGLPGHTMTLAKGVFGPEDLFDENIAVNLAQYQNRVDAGDNPWVAAIEEGRDAAVGLKDQFLATGGLITGLKGLSMVGPKGAAVAGGAGGVFGAIAPPLIASSIYQGVNAYLKERTGRSLNERIIMDTGYAGLLKTNRVTTYGTDADGNPQEVVTYEKDEEAQAAQAKVYNALKDRSKKEFPDQAHEPGDWYYNDGKYHIYQNYGGFSKSKSKGSGSEIPASSYL